MSYSIKQQPSRRRRTKVDEVKYPNKTNTVTIAINLVDAFVALGGNPDKSGVVRKSALI